MTSTNNMMDQTQVTSGQALYLLGFSPIPQQSKTLRLDDSTQAMLRHLGIESISTGTTCAWYKTIDRCDFEGDQGEKNLADIQWLTPRVIAHERVVSGLSQQLPFYPSRFGTLFSSQASLQSFTMNAQDTLAGFFERITSKKEWGLKFYGDLLKAAEIVAQREGIADQGKPLGGANYLKLRQLQREKKASTQSIIEQAYEQAVSSLQSQFLDILSRPIIASHSNSKQEDLVGNLAILVTEEESQQLLDWTQNWNQCNASEFAMRTELSGPWPAYSFCPSLSSEQARSAA